MLPIIVIEPILTLALAGYSQQRIVIGRLNQVYGEAHKRTQLNHDIERQNRRV